MKGRPKPCGLGHAAINGVFDIKALKLFLIYLLAC
jgi:hypothetical protein